MNDKPLDKNNPYPGRAAWAESFYKFGNDSKVALWMLDHTKDKRICIYCSKNRIISGRFGNEDMFGRNPVWHVWDGDEWVYCGQSRELAYMKYKERCDAIGQSNAVQFW